MVEGFRICGRDKGNPKRFAKALQEYVGDCWLCPSCNETKAEKEYVQG
jgi:hypothetical protein